MHISFPHLFTLYGLFELVLRQQGHLSLATVKNIPAQEWIITFNLSGHNLKLIPRFLVQLSQCLTFLANTAASCCIHGWGYASTELISNLNYVLPLICTIKHSGPGPFLPNSSWKLWAGNDQACSSLKYKKSGRLRFRIEMSSENAWAHFYMQHGFFPLLWYFSHTPMSLAASTVDIDKGSSWNREYTATMELLFAIYVLHFIYPWGVLIFMKYLINVWDYFISNTCK